MRKPHFRLPDGIAVAAGLALLLLAGLFAAFWPQRDFSDHERRYLSDAPSVPSLQNWETDQEIESYVSDRVPFRRALVAIDSAVHTLTGRRTQLEAWPVGGSYVEKPVSGDPATLEKRLSHFARPGPGPRWERRPLLGPDLRPAAGPSAAGANRGRFPDVLPRSGTGPPPPAFLRPSWRS